MIFMSMMFATVVLIILIVGLISLVLGIVLSVIWNKRKKKDQKFHGFLKFLTVLSYINGTVMFILPVMAYFLFSGKEFAENYKAIKEYDHIVAVDSSWKLKDGFEVEGTKYVYADFISPTKGYESEKYCVFVLDSNHYYECVRLENSMDESILYCESDAFVPEDKYDDIKEYYESVELSYKIQSFTNGESEGSFKTSLDHKFMTEISKMKSLEPNIQYTSQDETKELYITGYSKDYVYYSRINLVYIGDDVVLPIYDETDNLKGYVLPDSYAQAIKEHVASSN